VLLDDRPEPFALGLNGICVLITKAMPLMAHPQTKRDRQPALVRLRQRGNGFLVAPGAHRVRSGRAQTVEKLRAAATADKVRLAAAQQR
jgi:hypothetical protein